MRSDISKVLCECYKEGRADAMTSKQIRSKIKQSRHDEDGMYHSPSISIRKIIGFNSKGFGENLKPLARFLEKQVGRPWNKVYSEICAVCDRSGTVQAHIFQHLFGYIKVRVEKRDGKVYDLDGYRQSELYPRSLYVDHDGIIKIYKKNEPRYSYYRREKPKPEFEVINGVKYQQYKGIWYEAIDVIHQVQSIHEVGGKYVVGYVNVSSIKRRQLSHNELKKLKLTNSEQSKAA